VLSLAYYVVQLLAFYAVQYLAYLVVSILAYSVELFLDNSVMLLLAFYAYPAKKPPPIPISPILLVLTPQDFPIGLHGFIKPASSPDSLKSYAAKPDA